MRASHISVPHAGHLGRTISFSSGIIYSEARRQPPPVGRLGAPDTGRVSSGRLWKPGQEVGKKTGAATIRSRDGPSTGPVPLRGWGVEGRQTATLTYVEPKVRQIQVQLEP